MPNDHVPAFIAQASGKAVIETYTVIYTKHGSPKSVLIIGRDAQNRRFLAHAEADSAQLLLSASSVVGMTGKVRFRRARNAFEFD